MKYIVILGDGMADVPVPSLGGSTPLQAADTPNMDRLAAMGRSGMLHTVPAGYAPGSEVANLSVLGYDLDRVFEGRGSLEAASMGVVIAPGEMAMRCNLITVDGGLVKNHSAGHISTHEARELMDHLQDKLGDGSVSFWPGVSYRHLLKLRGGDKRIACTPPHDVPGTPARDVMVKAQVPGAQWTADCLNDLIVRSQELLAAHPVNLRRMAEGRDPANSIWPWSPGYRPKMETLEKLYGIRDGSVISAVDLIKGIGVYAGLEPVEVEGATGLHDTNYEGKARAALDALRAGDFVYLHIEASDEAGHEGDAYLKVRTIEYLDGRVLGPIMNELSRWDEPVRIALLPDHPTPVHLRTHTSDPVPFVIYDPALVADGVTRYDEFAAREGAYGEIGGSEFMKILISPQ